MYRPKAFDQSDFDLIRAFIAQYPLANVIAPNADSVEICSVPLLWQADDENALGCLIGHVAKLNPISNLNFENWQVVFTSQGHYISPNWYPSKAISHKEVPTWNYQSVVLSVTPQIIIEPIKIKQVVATMTDFFEQQLALTNPTHQPWSLNDAPSEYIDAMCRAIVGIKLSINSFEAKFKLSQNKTVENQLGVIEGLTQLQSTTADNMANLIKKSDNK